MSPDEVLARFRNPRRNRRGWTAKCPAHDDRANSLSVAIGDDGRTLVNCFAGCRAPEITAAVGLSLRDLFAEDHAARPRERRTLSPLEEARRDVLRLARRQPWARPGVLALYERADRLRAIQRAVDRVRRAAINPTEPRTWEALAIAAEIDIELEALDDVLSGAGGCL